MENRSGEGDCHPGQYRQKSKGKEEKSPHWLLYNLRPFFFGVTPFLGNGKGRARAAAYGATCRWMGMGGGGGGTPWLVSVCGFTCIINIEKKKRKQVIG